jgi:succinyl-CoA synthetase alpha subunit
MPFYRRRFSRFSLTHARSLSKQTNKQKQFYWGTNEILLPVYESMDEAFQKHPEVSVVVNFASFRSVYGSVMEMLENHSEQIKTIG